MECCEKTQNYDLLMCQRANYILLNIGFSFCGENVFRFKFYIVAAKFLTNFLPILSIQTLPN